MREAGHPESLGLSLHPPHIRSSAMRYMKTLSQLLAAFAFLSLLVPLASADAKPRGRKWESLGVVGNPGDCYEIWVRDHWWHGWQVVHEPTPCPGASGYVSGPGTGIFFAEASAYISLSKEFGVQHVFGDAVSFPLEQSDKYLGPILNYGAKSASLVDMTADGESVLSERIEPTAYVDAVWVLKSHEVNSIFTGAHQAALVTLSEDGTSIKKLHKVIQVEPLQK